MKNDKMRNPISKEIYRIDDRLLLSETWTNTPEMALNFIKELIKNPIDNKTYELAVKFLNVTENSFINKKKIPHKGVILVLGHVLGENGNPSKDLIGRLEVALKTHIQNPELKFLLSGGGTNKYFTEAEVMKNWLLTNGVLYESIIIEDKSLYTVENIKYSLNILKEHKENSICLVTSSNHMARSFILLEQYSKYKNINLEISTQEYKNESLISNFHLEQFTLFKDLGRILDIWEYSDYQIPK